MLKIIFPQYQKGKQGMDFNDCAILDCIRKIGIEIHSDCGGIGKCGKCVVRIDKGSQHLNDKTHLEKKFRLKENERLACQAKPKPLQDGEVYVYIEDPGKYDILSESMETRIEINPCVTKKEGKVLCGGRDAGKYAGKILGLAIDLGTTTVVVQVIDLENGKLLETIVFKNPQISFGNDVISRIGYIINNKDGLKELQSLIVNTINHRLNELEKARGGIKKYIYEAVIVGNSTMRSIIFGQKVDTLGVIPFEPFDCKPVNIEASAIGLEINPAGNTYGPPLIGGQVGADALAVIIASRMYENKNVTMAIDIGTNGEIAIGNKDKIMTVSCATGGAYEGASISCGMGAIEGAIKNIWINEGKADYTTIGGKPAVGICGSGLIDLLAELLKNNLMDKRARLNDKYNVTDRISVTQEDVFQLITAKASLRLDIDLLMKYYKVTVEQVEKFYLAGAFGNYINSESAIDIGLLPPVAEKIVKIGNAALAGAREILLSQELRKKAEELAPEIEHIKVNELEPDFAYLMAGRMYF